MVEMVRLDVVRLDVVTADGPLGYCERCARWWRRIGDGWKELVEQPPHGTAGPPIARCPICRHAERQRRERERAEWEAAGRPL